MTLADLIARLEAADPTQVVRHGFTHPHSYRGDYMDLAFEPATDVSVAAMLAAARSALGATFQGYKGGEFTMGEHTWCWLSAEGDASGETISALLLDLMLAPVVLPASVDRAATAAVRALHQPMSRAGFLICAHCSGWNGVRCLGVVADYPCPTIAALDESASAVVVRRATDETPGARHAPGVAILCPDCRTKGHSVCMGDGPAS